ncbi:hypothetical protein KCU64_g12164, partial [Aureobasidium melanogenum]
MIANSILFNAIASLALLSGSAAALAMPEQVKDLQARGTRPISVEAACNVFYGTSFSAQTTGNGCNDWVCVRGNERYGLDLNEWCGGKGASCSNGVYSWVCNY